jgi:hypothetical protein
VQTEKLKIQSLTDAALAINEAEFWEFGGGTRNSQGHFAVDALRRNALPLPASELFDGIAQDVFHSSSFGQNRLKFIGNLVGLNTFVALVTGELDKPNII